MPVDGQGDGGVRTAWVTGAAGGIGRATCLRLVEDGARLVVLDVIDPAISGAQWIPWNAMRQEETIVILRRLLDTLGPPDVLVLCAGVARSAPIGEFDPEEWDEVLAVNLRAPMLFLAQLLPAMMTRRTGRIVAISSGVAVRPTRGSAAYAASKAGLVALIKVAALESAPANVTANVICPGITDTPMVRARWSREELEQMARSSPIANPMGAVLEAADIADAVAYLCSPSSIRITGQTLHVNAGAIMP